MDLLSRPGIHLEYVLIAQNQYRVEQFVRQDGGPWLYTATSDSNAIMRLSSIECELRVLTGLLFGLASAWLVLPRLDASFGRPSLASQYAPDAACERLSPLSPRG